VFKVVIVLVSGLYLVGCAVPYPSNDAKAYLKSQNGPRLVVPSPMQQDEISSFYDLPNAEGNKRVNISP
jgi:hypothetical protein